MNLQKINYNALSAKQQEIYNFQQCAALLANYGFNCIKLADDWKGADFLAYHNDGDTTLKVQLKGRVDIQQKYRGKNLHMAFPAGGFWYLIEHDELVRIIEETWACSPRVKKKTLEERGGYSTPNPSKALIEKLEDHKIGERTNPA